MYQLVQSGFEIGATYLWKFHIGYSTATGTDELTGEQGPPTTAPELVVSSTDSQQNVVTYSTQRICANAQGIENCTVDEDDHATIHFRDVAIQFDASQESLYMAIDIIFRQGSAGFDTYLDDVSITKVKVV